MELIFVTYLKHAAKGSNGNSMGFFSDKFFCHLNILTDKMTISNFDKLVTLYKNT